MCEASAYLVDNDTESLILESVDILEPLSDDSYRLENIFGEQKVVKGRIQKMELVNHKIIFVPNPS